MARIQPVDVEKVNSDLQEMYKSIERKTGRIPNLLLTMGHSSAVLKAYLGLAEAVNKTSLSPKLREEIALIVGQTNQCNYCLSAHTAIAQHAGIQNQEIIQARKAQSQDPKTQAILSFAKTVVEKRGNVSDQDVAALKEKGISDAEIVEIILNISVNMFTNYFNHITDPKIDFPIAPKII